MKTNNVLSISGGKDSTALWILAKERGEEITPVFADTGHEHPETYKYIEYLQTKLGPLKIVKADFSARIEKKREYVKTKWREEGIEERIIQRALATLKPSGIPFLDLCIWKGRFPSTNARFCTEYLKIIPIMEQVYMPLLEAGEHVTSWQGVRAAESPARAKLPEKEDTPEGYAIYRPLLTWSARDVFNKHKEHGIEPNPLYFQGMGRVGCMPCIHAGKEEMYQISRRYPEEIERVAEWERIVEGANKKEDASFFSKADGKGNDIWDIVEWSKTTRGGKQYDLMKLMDFENVPQCMSNYGLCE